MLILLSPAKNLDYTPSVTPLAQTKPRMESDIAAISNVTRKLSRRQIAKLMDLSEPLAELNYQRFQAFDPSLPADSVLQAALAFNGDVYQGLRARSLSGDDLDFAQDHLRILSGFYGLLRPLDTIAPYRLEMGTKLKTARGSSLYEFWGPRISKAINADMPVGTDPIVVNLASSEYFGAVDKKTLAARVITCHFKELKDGKARVLSFYAKRARGMMARFAIVNRITNPEGLKAFDEEGYRFDEAASTQNDWVFCRPQPELKGK
jgi:uncharacterized protein